MNLCRRQVEDLSARLATQVLSGERLSEHFINLTLETLLADEVLSELIDQEQDCLEGLEAIEALVPHLLECSTRSEVWDVVAEIRNKLQPVFEYVSTVEGFEVNPVVIDYQDAVRRVLNLVRQLKRLGEPEWIATGISIVLKLLDAIVEMKKD